MVRLTPTGGEGWASNPGPGMAIHVLGLGMGVALVGLGVGLLTQGVVAAGGICVALGLALGAVPFLRPPPVVPGTPLPSGALAGDVVEVPIRPLRAFAVPAFAVLATLLLVAAVLAGWQAAQGRWAGLLGALVCGVVSAGFWVGVVSQLRLRRHPRVLRLSPQGLVVPDRPQGVELSWSDVEAVRPHWTRTMRSTGWSTGSSTNWLTFVLTPEAAARVPASPMKVLSGVSDPSLDVNGLAADPALVLELIERTLGAPSGPSGPR